MKKVLDENRLGYAIMNITQSHDDGSGPIFQEKLLNPRDYTSKTIQELYKRVQSAGVQNLLKKNTIKIIVNPAYIDTASLSPTSPSFVNSSTFMIPLADLNPYRVKWTSLAKEGKEAVLANGRHRITMVKRFYNHPLEDQVAFYKKELQKSSLGEKRRTEYKNIKSKLEDQITQESLWLVEFYDYGK